jgi:F-type H+-transporting ATPase subunit delta
MAAVLSRYARALVDVVMDKKLDPKQTLDQLNSLVGLVDSSADLRRVWESPAVPVEQKRTLLDSLASRLGLSQWVRNFAAVLIDHHRIAALAPISKQFETELFERLGMAEAEVTSSRELNNDERREIEQRIEQFTGKKVRARYVIDTKLLGGAVVKMGSTVYDGSVRGQLFKIKEQLTAL